MMMIAGTEEQKGLGEKIGSAGNDEILERADTPDEDSLMTYTIGTTDRTHRLLIHILRRANGGSDPALIRLSIGDTALPADADEIGDRRQRLHVTTDSSGRLVAAIGIATHWKMLWSVDLTFCTAPSGMLFLQSFHTPPLYAWVAAQALRAGPTPKEWCAPTPSDSRSGRNLPVLFPATVTRSAGVTPAPFAFGAAESAEKN